MSESENKTKENSIDKKVTTYIWWVVAIALAGFIFLFSFYYYFHDEGLGFNSKPDEWGAFGDFIGGIMNPLIASLALIGLALTLLMQIREFREIKENFERDFDYRKRNTEIERVRLVTNEFIDHFHSQDFLGTRNAVWTIREKVLSGDLSITFIANGYIFPVSKGEYYEGEEMYGASEHGHLTLQLGYIERVGHAIQRGQIDKSQLKKALQYEMRWYADFLRSIAIVSEQICQKRQNSITPSFVEHVLLLLDMLELTETLDSEKHYEIKDSEKDSNQPEKFYALISSQEKRELTLSFYTEWFTGLEAIRKDAWDYLKARYEENLMGQSKEIDLNDSYFRTGDKGADSVLRVLKFMGELDKLIKSELIDINITRALFQHSLTTWFYFTNNVVYKLDENASDYQKEVQKLYEAVRSLSSSFQN